LLVTHHSALRRYYITRNGIVIAARYWRREAAWVRISLWVLGIGFAGVVLFERPKLRKIGATLLGIVDAIRGRMGKATAKWLAP
jgi:rhamnosyltransferase